MERGVEDGHVRHGRQLGSRLPQSVDGGAHVQRSKLDQTLELRDDVIVDEDRIPEARTAVNQPVCDRPHLRRRSERSQLLARPVVIYDGELQARRSRVDG